MSWALLLLACGGSDPAPVDTAAGVVLPRDGDWTLTWPTQWAGTCALENDLTGSDGAETWGVRSLVDSFVLWDPWGSSIDCAVDGDRFTCRLPAYETDGAASGYDVIESVAHSFVGTLTDTEHFDAVWSISAACQGDDCAEWGQFYGADFTYPCAAEAAVDGQWTGE